MDFGEIFGTAMQLIRRTLPTFLGGAVLLMLGYTLYTYTMIDMMGAMAHAAESGLLGPNPDPEQSKMLLQLIMPSLGMMILSVVLFLIVLQFVQVLATLTSWDAINEQPIGFGEAIGRSFGRPFWIALVQGIIVGAVLMAVFFLALIVLAGASGGQMGAGGSAASLVIGLPLIIGVAIVYLLISLRVHTVVAEGRGPWNGLIGSITLVKTGFLKTFGVLFLAGLGFGAVSFIVSMLLGGPSGSMNFGGNNDPDAIIESYKRMQEAGLLGVGVANGLVSGLGLMFTSYLLTPLYVDLRARRGDFDELPDQDGLELV